MVDPGGLLATLAQSSAAIVAIVGGFLVSRLVALSSEREALRRQLVSVKDELRHVAADYEAAHAYRFENSRDTFIDWTLSEVIAAGPDLDVDQILDKHGVPRGSSVEEMAPVLEALRKSVADAETDVRRYIQAGDDNRLTLSDLLERGLSVNDRQDEVYEHVVDHIAENELPEPPGYLGIGAGLSPLLRPSYLSDPASRTTEMRRLDESISAEQDLHARKSLLEVTVDRLARELAAIGRPAGVQAAIWILAAYSLLGILVPVLVMAFGPEQLSSLWSGILIGLFVLGLASVLAYILWYARTLDDPANLEH